MKLGAILKNCQKFFGLWPYLLKHFDPPTLPHPNHQRWQTEPWLMVHFYPFLWRRPKSGQRVIPKWKTDFKGQQSALAIRMLSEFNLTWFICLIPPAPFFLQMKLLLDLSKEESGMDAFTWGYHKNSWIDSNQINLRFCSKCIFL